LPVEPGDAEVDYRGMGRRSRVCRFSLLWALAGAILAAGCNSTVKPSQTGVQTFTLTGVIRSSATALPLVDTTVEAVGLGSASQLLTLLATTGADGRYTFTGLRGIVTLRALKDGFNTGISTVDLNRDRSFDVVLDLAVVTFEGGEVTIGQTLRGAFAPTNDNCDPNWDSRSPCRRFGFYADVARAYEFRVDFPTCDELELHVLKGGQRLVYASTVSPIVKGASLSTGWYEIRLMAYYTCGAFELTVR
jgi:hypothetical protein